MAEQQQSQSGGLIGNLAILGIGAFAVYEMFQYLDKDRSDKETKEAQEATLRHTISIQKTNQRIAALENRAIVSGMNGFGKNVQVNVINEAKDAIASIYNVITLQSGLVKYYLKPKKDMNAKVFYNSIFSVPVKSLSVFSKVYAVYTGKNFLDDARNLDVKTYQSIKALYATSVKKFPAEWKK